MTTSKNPLKYECLMCDYNTSNKKDYNKHESTYKHQCLANGRIKVVCKNPQINIIKNYTCGCGKNYKHKGSLWNHQKKCLSESAIKQNTENNESELKELVVKLMNENNEIKNMMVQENTKLQKQNYELQKQNQDILKQSGELQKQVLDVCKNIQPNITNTHTNSHNKTFNLQFFLNEQCKDAMNISDFIKSVSLSIQDLERVGTLGYVEGISSIIIKELRNLDIHKRPMHCSDTKRETLYIKDEDKWEKEDHENKKIKNVIKSVEHKNIKMINEWTKEHSSYKASDDKDNDKYLNIVLEAAGGIGDYEEKGNKIIKKIAKEVAIDK